jgi:uncharacterized membrane protein
MGTTEGSISRRGLVMPTKAGGEAHFHVIGLLLFVALLVVGVVWFVRRFLPAQVTTAAVPAAVAEAPAGADPAVAMLRMRYAKGEVSREDFQHAVADLTGAAGAWPDDRPEDASPEDTAQTTS